MTDKRLGDWIQTARGGRFYPLDPRPEEVYPEDVAHSLATLNRYSGHARLPLSVAQHSVLVASLLPPQFALQGLLHDAHEAYLGDWSRPLVVSLRAVHGDAFAEALLVTRDAVDRAVFGRFGLCPTEESYAAVKKADTTALSAEARVLMSPLDHEWEKSLTPDPPDPSVAVPGWEWVWGWREAEDKFLDILRSLTGGRF